MYNWTREITAPFLSHRVRLWVHTMADMQETFTSLVVVQVLNISSLIRHMYRSAMVQTVEMVQKLYTLMVSARPSACSQSYQISYMNLPFGQTTSREMEAPARPSLLLTKDVESCTEYEVKVVLVREGGDTVRRKQSRSQSAANQMEITIKARRVI